MVRATSVVYIGARLTFAALLVAFGTWKLRVWNPGQATNRASCGREPEVEGIETLIEIERKARGRRLSLGERRPGSAQAAANVR